MEKSLGFRDITLIIEPLDYFWLSNNATVTNVILKCDELIRFRILHRYLTAVLAFCTVMRLR